LNPSLQFFEVFVPSPEFLAYVIVSLFGDVMIATVGGVIALTFVLLIIFYFFASIEKVTPK
jgi:uncharacterized membrane protein